MDAHGLKLGTQNAPAKATTYMYVCLKGDENVFKVLVQGVSTLSAKSNLLISPTKNWFIFDSLASNSPLDNSNLHSCIDFH